MTADGNDIYSLRVSRGAVKSVLTVIGVLILLVVVAVLSVVITRASSGSDALASQVNTSQYQAVFLTSSEVYFGKLTVSSGQFCYLTHVYRLTSQSTGNKKQPLKRTLVRITTDVHSPTDELIINKSEILYVENLNPNGQAAGLLTHGGP